MARIEAARTVKIVVWEISWTISNVFEEYLPADGNCSS